MREPPKKLSVTDEDYDPDVGFWVVVKVDGQEQKYVVSYDTEAGTVIKLKHDGERFQLNEAKDEVVEEVVHGAVTVEWKSC